MTAFRKGFRAAAADGYRAAAEAMREESDRLFATKETHRMTDEELNERVDAYQEVASSLDNAADELEAISFPGMY